MKPWSLRNKSRISYCESIEPPLDNYVYCDKCADFVYEYCSIHGPLLVIPDNKVSEDSELLAFVPKAALTIPNVFLHIAVSYIPGAGLGVFSSISLPSGVRFGPYCGDIKTDIQSDYCWQIYDNNNKPRHVVDAADLSRGNWMRYVNCSRHYSEQNLIAYQYEGQLYYRTIKLIPRFTELLVFYGGEFASSLHIDLKLYNNPNGGSKLQYSTPNSAGYRKINQETDLDSITEIEKTDSSNNESYIDIPFHNDTISITSTNESDEDLANEDILANKDNVTNNYNVANIYNVYEDDVVDRDILTNEVNAANTNNLANDYNLTHNNEANRDISTNEDNLQDEKVVNSLNTVQSNGFTQTKTNIIMISGLYSCMHCNFKRPYKNVVSKHILTNHKQQCFPCVICNTSFVSQNNLHTHIQSHTTQTHSCNVCNYKTINKHTYNRHLQTHNKWYNCLQCDFKCKTKISLHTHIQSHTTQTYSCNVCNYITINKHSLNKHLQTHDKWYNCLQCDFKCKTKISLHTHIQSHTIQTYSCNKCNYKTMNKHNLNRHLQRHDKWYNCSQCDFKCKTKMSLVIHFRIHSNIELFKCNQCYYNSPSRKNFRNHLLRHKKTMPDNLEN